ncbi:MAG: GLUG motif-containing protein [Peptococcia bacterium]
MTLLFLDKHFQLACDIDATNTVNWNNGAGFVPIGNPANKFTGYFDGAGHTITGLSINQPERDNVGLFGCTEGGEIKNLGLVDCAISGGNNVGSLVGHNQNTYLENCFSTGTVSGTSVVGGLVGYGSGAYAGGRYYLDNCYSRASVQGEVVTGGLIGELGSGWLKNCYASGSVQGIENTGGMVGSLATANCQQTNCYWDIDASGQASSALGIG